MLKWLKVNLGTILLSFILAVTVWIVAVNQDDPRIERTLTEPIEIQFEGLRDDVLIINPSETHVFVTLLTTTSKWDELSPQEVHLVADLHGRESGRIEVTLQPIIDRPLIKVTSIDPKTVTVTLEKKDTKELDVQVVTAGSPTLSYTAEDPIADPDSATVIGPESAVARVVELRAEINLTNRQESWEELVALAALDADGRPVENIQLSPDTVRVAVQISQQPNYRLVSVIPRIEGQTELEEAGYLVTEVTVTPQWVTIFSSDPQAFEDLPGYIETMPLDLTGAVEDVEQQLQLDLPPGFDLAMEQSVTVKVDIEPRTNSITISRPLEVRGVGLNLYALPSPDTVSIILTGPAAILNSLDPEEVFVIIDVSDLTPGTYQVTPQILGIPELIEASDPIPSTLQVTISIFPFPSSTPES